MKVKLKGYMTIEQIEDWLLIVPRHTRIKVKAVFEWKQAEKDA